MPNAEDLRKTIADSTPFYAFAGTVDLTVEKAREVPALIEKFRSGAPDRIAAVRASTDPKVVSEKVTERAKEAQTRLTEMVASIDVKQFRESAQGFALQQVGRAAEAAVKAREAYDELAERGRVVVGNLRGDAADKVEDAAAAIEPSTPAPSKSTPSKSTPTDSAPTEAAAEPADAEPAKPAAKKAAPRKSAPRKSGQDKPAE
jgi:hypothetical protein